MTKCTIKITSKMTKDEKAAARVAVCKDVLKQIKDEAIELTNYHYLDGYMQLFVGEKIEPDEQAQKHIDRVSDSCSVCAKGALFLSFVKKFNKVQMFELGVNEYNNSEAIDIHVSENKICKLLRPVFSKSMLDKIEDIFSNIQCVQYSDRTDCENYGAQFQTYEECLAAIMKNIIKNNGQLVVPKYVPLEETIEV